MGLGGTVRPVIGPRSSGASRRVYTGVSARFGGTGRPWGLRAGAGQRREVSGCGGEWGVGGGGQVRCPVVLKLAAAQDRHRHFAGTSTGNFRLPCGT
ncbi:hypothetical protein GCM10018793_54660 [Streptomyces sulfonofaciens]|uniref:Uncharacterized protein n=1 Tax=Streptomyces sulfonofaciens TaxID=68272 RepID=A0A919GIX5_9ACTN|nr:hypothetical protein GCM10018793_54660 [Streptomyces sulfonofaciens]